jgi:DNA-binding NarL/FixJ family response regulator
MTARYGIVIADDHPIFLAGLRNLIALERDFDLIGEATDGLAALAIIEAKKPEITVLDITLPRLNGLELARRISKSCPPVRILMLTLHEDNAYLNQAFEAGAHGYLLKRSAAESFNQAVRAVADGGTFVDPAMTKGYAKSSKFTTSSTSIELTLSDRETAVLKFVALGLTNKEISSRLNLSVKSIETYRSRGAEKLGLMTRADIVRFASSQGWFENI